MAKYISKEEWELVNYVRNMGNPHFAKAFRHQDEEGNNNDLMCDPWHFIAYYFHLNFCCWTNNFEDRQLDWNDDAAHRERVLARQKAR